MIKNKWLYIIACIFLILFILLLRIFTENKVKESRTNSEYGSLSKNESLVISDNDSDPSVYNGGTLESTAISYLKDVSSEELSFLESSGASLETRELLSSTLGDYCRFIYFVKFEDTYYALSSDSDICIPITKKGDTYELGPMRSIYGAYPGVIDEVIGLNLPRDFLEINDMLRSNGIQNICVITKYENNEICVTDIISKEQYKFSYSY